MSFQKYPFFSNLQHYCKHSYVSVEGLEHINKPTENTNNRNTKDFDVSFGDNASIVSTTSIRNQPTSDESSLKFDEKHTRRPTFTREQINVLEKLFEETKYMAGRDRSLLATELGMREAQIKVCVISD